MSSRHEFKYILSHQQATAIEHFIQRVGIPRDVSQNGDYTVTSLYFDSPRLTDFYDKLAGYKKRKKMRARIYSEWFDDEKRNITLEIKEKHDMNILKKKARVFASTNDLIKNMDSVLSNSRVNPDLQEFKYLFYVQGYRPHIVIRYNRHAFEQSFKSKVRITFDRNIESCKLLTGMTYSPMVSVTNKVIMEIKFSDALPWWFQYIVRNFGLAREPFSKYSESIDKLNDFYPIPR